MTKCYEEIMKARLAVGAEDATYAAQFDTEYLKGWTWEFDPMSDAIGQKSWQRTEKIRVRFNPVKDSMVFPEDCNRQKEYIMDIDSARILWKFLAKKTPQYWFALDMACHGSKHGLVDLADILERVEGCAASVEIV